MEAVTTSGRNHVTESDDRSGNSSEPYQPGPVFIMKRPNRTERLKEALRGIEAETNCLTETPFGGTEPTPDELWQGIVRIKVIAEKALVADARRNLKDHAG